jgi:lipopolysaccharide transport system ATP-binding protein
MRSVISVENLGKKYLLSHRSQDRYPSLREMLANGAKRLAGTLRHPFSARGNDSHEEFWALKDVSFEIKQGDRVGIIGRNGAGKSTLLKILSRITEPTTGRVKIAGRVANLLEVGTGFHPELTGRENIYLNGAILGMTKAEIKAKFDEIVSFAEVEKFLDTPVKHYSSGMYVRLAFSVAAHLEPEILIVDEVLAVGDASFQQKCLSKMEQVGSEGRTILFVSHNLASVRRLCSTTILLSEGRLLAAGPIQETIRSYIDTFPSNGVAESLANFDHRKGSGLVRFVSVKIQDGDGHEKNEFSLGDAITISFQLQASDAHIGKALKLAVRLKSDDGINLCHMTNADSGIALTNTARLESLSIRLNDIRLYPGTYYISLWSGSEDSSEDFDFVFDCAKFEIVDGGELTTRRLLRAEGVLFLTPEWNRGTPQTSQRRQSIDF